MEGKYASKNMKEVLAEIVAQRLPVSAGEDVSTLHDSYPQTQGMTPQLDWSLSDKEDTPSCHSEEPEPRLQLLPSDSSSESEGEEPAPEIE